MKQASRFAALALVLALGCGRYHAPLPLPAADRRWVPPLPAPAAPRDVALPAPTLPAITSFVLPCGMTVEIVERRATPVVHVALAGRGTQSAEYAPAELDEVIELALGRTVASDESEERSDDRQHGAEVGERGLVLTSRVVPSELDGVLARYAAIMEGQAPSRDRIDLARLSLLDRARFEHDQRRRRRVPTPAEDLATRLYGEAHPRVARMRLRPTSVERVDADRVRHRLARLLAPSESALVIVGDVDAAAVEAAVRERFASVPARPEAPPATREAPVFPDPPTRLYIHGTSGEPSAFVRLVEHGPAIEHDDYAAFRLLARLAGGIFSSRLNLRLRESRGDAYGIMTRVTDRFDHSLLEISVIVPVSAASNAAVTMIEELARLSDASRIEAEELEIARTVELAELDAELETSTGLGHALVAAFLAREAPSSITETYARVAALDASDIARTAHRWVRPEKAPMVIVGDYVWLFTHPVRVPGGVAFIDE